MMPKQVKRPGMQAAFVAHMGKGASAKPAAATPSPAAKPGVKKAGGNPFAKGGNPFAKGGQFAKKTK